MANELILYKNYETIIINDGSKDNTLKILKDFLNLQLVDYKVNEVLKHKQIKNIYKSMLYKNIVVIDKDNGGKADALNAGINYSSKEIVVTIDADSMIKKNNIY